VCKKLSVLGVFLSLTIAWGLSESAPSSSAQDILAPYKSNNCVTCHSRVASPLKLTSRYAEWHMSSHREKEVGCEKCHGGDPKISEAKSAHKGVLAPADVNSRLHARNLPETCNGCHQGVVGSFVESKHYQNLKGVGLGPSCSTCHAHMASEVIYTAEQTSTLCSSCHNSSNAMMPRRLEIPVQAGETMEAIRRANMMTAWADRLLEEAHKRKMDMADADKEMKIVRAMLSEAKVSWHAFNLDVVRRKADAAYETGTKLKDDLRGKLYPQ
jgi:nitrate/TMAO reductase-like tetraheme cytochrome c subunit